MKSPGGGNKTKSGRMMKAQTATGPPSNSAQLIALRKASPAPQHSAPSSSEESSPNFTSGLRKAASVEKQAPSSEEASPNFTSGLRKAAPVDRPTPAATANPNFTAGLKTSGADKTKSGRLKKAQAATGPAPSPDFRAGLKKNPTSTN